MPGLNPPLTTSHLAGLGQGSGEEGGGTMTKDIRV